MLTVNIPDEAKFRLVLLAVMSDQTFDEISIAILRGKWDSSHLSKLDARLRSVAIIPYDIEICRTFGNLKATLERSGQSVATNDLWIAACAKRHSLALVTHSRKHFENIPGITVISEAP